MSGFVKGVCEDLCPQNEAKLRIREKLLHYFEYKNGQKHVPGKLVKCFSRSAADKKIPRPQDMRTEGCLQRCVEYLLREIVLDNRKPYNIVYDFIFDRLRSVRQEIVMQDYNAKQTIKLLEPMIMFLCYSRYKLTEEAIDNFDPKICEQHLQECLKRALVCYDEIPTKELNLLEIRRRTFIESLYQIFNLGSLEAMKRCLTVDEDIKSEPLFELVFKICLSHIQGNLYRVLNGIQGLPHILCAIGSLKLPTLRRQLYHVFAHAYSSKQLLVPVDFVLRLSGHASKYELFEDCKYYNINLSEDKQSLHFQKTDFKNDLAIQKCKHEQFVDIKIKNIYLPEILLLKKF
ncbi:SAC3 domain-containing protein 1 [Musca vetustissima]|uniref:SAC3 domain-containing protein 1 n=1 Tax=Musca vetustissima TaxID=27455 RepID=UPI002AB774FA|nr:SAC3 domain-containing protein 1 [Musca vetustissima]